MGNIFEEVAEVLKDGASAIAKGESWLGHLGADIKMVYEAGVKLAPETAKDLGLVVSDVESFALLTSGAVSSEGVNFAADSAAYAAFQKLLTDLKSLGGNLKKDVEALKAVV